MAELTCEQARQIVDEIGQRNGIITDEDRAAAPPAVIKALQSVRNQLGSYRHPWTPCDTPDVRRDVVFQLISSARSLHYNWAKRQGKEPYFSLDVSPDRIIVDTNDDGCLKSDIIRLSEGGASLSNARTSNLYDAVLPYASRIAREAHVQSGPFSFALGPRSPGDRLGFATPVNTDPAPLPGGVRTRITLYPAVPEGFDIFVHEFQNIATDGFVLLDPDDTRQPMCKNFVFIARKEGFRMIRLTYEVQLRDGILKVTKTRAGLSPFSLPLYTERFLLYQPSIPSSFVKMALLFPIDEYSRPVIRPRKACHIVGSFAFPISGVGLSFVVCATVTKFDSVRDADVDTSTLLQNIVIDCFCDAVSFCQNHSMPYGWVQYIPKQSTVSPPWQKTVQALIKDLRVAPVFQSQNGVLKSLSSLRYLSLEHYGGDNEQPLFGASDDEHYLSTRYGPYLDFLRSIGLQEVSDHEVLERLKPIMTKPLRVLPSSRRMSLILRLLIVWLKRDPNDALATEIRNIPIIELSNGSFLRGNDLNSISSEADLAFAKDAVYFPTDTNGNEIPKCLDILTVSEEAVRDNDQKELLRLLGVRRACPELVMGRISRLSHYSAFPVIADFMHILCYVYDSYAKDDRLEAPCLMIFDEHRLRRLVCRNSCPTYIPYDVYLRTDGAYGTAAIAKRLDSGSLFSPRLLLLHPTLLFPNLISKTHIPNDTWRIWLEQQRITRRVPRLTHWNGKQLSDLLKAIISYHPDILLGILGRYWDTYGTEIHEEPLIASAIKKAKVPTLTGLARLDECYFPIPEICSMVEAVSTTLNINFLQLPGTWGPGSEQEWGFLRELGVSGGGAVTVIKVVKDRLLSTMTVEDAKPHFFELYRWISEGLSADLLEFFDDEKTVYVPNSDDGAELVSLDQCVWHGPSWLRTVHALAFHEEYASDSKIRGLFSDTLNVQNADWGTYLTELMHLKAAGVGLIEETRRIYQAIMEDIEDEEDWNSLRRVSTPGQCLNAL